MSANNSNKKAYTQSIGFFIYLIKKATSLLSLFLT